jgi:hypothetical protein
MLNYNLRRSDLLSSLIAASDHQPECPLMFLTNFVFDVNRVVTTTLTMAELQSLHPDSAGDFRAKRIYLL